MARWLEVKAPAVQTCHPSSIPGSHVNVKGFIFWCPHVFHGACATSTTCHSLVKLKFDLKLLKLLWDQYSNVCLVYCISNNTFRNSHDGVYPPWEHKGRGLCTWGHPGQYSKSQTRAVRRLKYAVVCLQPRAALYVCSPSPPTSMQGQRYLKKMNSLHKLLTEW